MLRFDPGVDQLFQHIQRHGAGTEDDLVVVIGGRDEDQVLNTITVFAIGEDGDPYRLERGDHRGSVRKRTEAGGGTGSN